jgi:hypothetical protein
MNKEVLNSKDYFANQVLREKERKQAKVKR